MNKNDTLYSAVEFITQGMDEKLRNRVYYDAKNFFENVKDINSVQRLKSIKGGKSK